MCTDYPREREGERENQDALFKFFHPFCLKYRSPAWSAAANSHLKLDTNTCKFLIPNLSPNLQHWIPLASVYAIQAFSCLHPLHSGISNLSYPRRLTRDPFCVNSLSSRIPGISFWQPSYGMIILSWLKRFWSCRNLSLVLMLFWRVVGF